MHVTTQTFWLPKAGNADSEYEDAFWPASSADTLPLHGFRCALADGATETSFSGAWAKLLTRRWYDESGDPARFLACLPELRGQWGTQIETVPMAWYAEEKARAGAFSSLLGLTLLDNDPASGWPAHWEAVAVGDSCLFQMRAGVTDFVAFPLRHSVDFNNSPYLLSTVSQSVEEVTEHLSTLGGRCIPGDVFYLMTDALACWFLRLTEGDDPADVFIADIHTQSRFADFVQEWRNTLDAEGRPYLRNDDVTLYRLEIHE